MQIRGVIEAYALIIVALPLKKPAQILCPNPKTRITRAARRIDSFSVTTIAFFALLIFPAPSSFETLVLP